MNIFILMIYIFERCKKIGIELKELRNPQKEILFWIYVLRMF